MIHHQNNNQVEKSLAPTVHLHPLIAICNKLEDFAAPKILWQNLTASRQARVLTILQQLPQPILDGIQSAVVGCTDLYKFAAEQTPTNSGEKEKNINLLLLTCRRLGISPPNKDILDKIQGQDVVEILDSNYLQVFRNMRFFALSNYSIEELITSPWYELYERSSKVTDQLMALGAKLLDNQTISDSELPAPYTIVEKQTEEAAAFEISEKILTRLEHGIEKSAFILSVKSAKPLSDKSANIKYI